MTGFGSRRERGAPFTPPRLGRRHLLASSIGAAVGASALGAEASSPRGFHALWRDFRQRFVASDGRVVDTGNGGVSHSEGQGYALLFAAQADDRDAFRAILGFTRSALRVRGDALHAWRFDPRRATPVSDRNNATDGDVGIAWGLLHGAARWMDGELAVEAQAILRDVFRLTAREVNGQLLLLPGAFGFEGRDHVVQNPSYAMFPAWAELRHIAPGLPWSRLERDSLATLERGLFGARALPADWVQLTHSTREVTMPDRWPKRFSYDAIRVPLHLAWSGHRDHPAMRSVISYWSRVSPAATPAWVELPTDRVAEYRAAPGMLAVRAVATGDRGLFATALSASSDDYYSASLRLLSRMAASRLGWT